MSEDKDLDRTKKYYEDLRHFINTCLVQPVDFGVVPGTSGKPSLFQPGAQKLMHYLGVVPSFPSDRVHRIEQLDPPFFSYEFTCMLRRAEGGDFCGECTGSANSKEARHVKASPFGIANTLIKSAQKRAMVGAVVMVAGVSQFFTQDVEDMARSDVQGGNASQSRQEARTASSEAQGGLSWRDRFLKAAHTLGFLWKEMTKEERMQWISNLTEERIEESGPTAKQWELCAKALEAYLRATNADIEKMPLTWLNLAIGQLQPGTSMINRETITAQWWTYLSQHIKEIKAS